MFQQNTITKCLKYFYHFAATKPQIISMVDGKQICNFQLLEEAQGNVQCVVVVNNRLNISWLQKALNCCDNVVLADGGANRFYDTQFRDSKKVRAIVGDFDSLKPNVRQFYDRKGVQIQQVWNQDTNDFEKAVKKAIDKGWNKIFCFGAFGGRMDHTLSSMHHAQKLSKQHPNLRICLFGQTNIMYYLRPNIQHEIIVCDNLEKTYCGLIPFGRIDYISTKGLKWNLGVGFPHQSLQWGNFISTSNQIEGNKIQVESSSSLFFVSHFKDARSLDS